jgi:hypothetical protein
MAEVTGGARIIRHSCADASIEPASPMFAIRLQRIRTRVIITVIALAPVIRALVELLSAGDGRGVGPMRGGGTSRHVWLVAVAHEPTTSHTIQNTFTRRRVSRT